MDAGTHVAGRARVLRLEPRLTEPARSGPALRRLPLLVAGMAALAAGVAAGLVRAGVPVPGIDASLVALHAALMIGGFFGTVIGLERAVAHGAWPAYAAPTLAAFGAIALVAGAPVAPVAALQAGAGLALVAATWRLHARQPTLHSLVLVVGAACWPLGTLAWLAGAPLSSVVGLWSDFLVLTIAGERLELSRLMPPKPRARAVFGALVAGCLGAAAWGPLNPAAADAALGACYLALAGWLIRHDIARRTARAAGLTGFIGRALLSGYAWLVVGGALLVVSGAGGQGLARDAALHAVLVGFVLSMVLGHAPLIFPAVLRVRMPYHRSFHLPLALLHASLALRVVAAVGGWVEGRAIGAAGNALAIVAFVAVTLAAVVRGARLAPGRAKRS